MKVLDRGKKREYCETLGVPLDANEKVVKKAFHKLALELHPDRPHNRGRTDIDVKFKQVAEAYEQLMNGSYALNSIKQSFRSEDIHSSLEHFFFTTKSHSNSLSNIKFNNLVDTNSGSGSFTRANNTETKIPNFHPQMNTNLPNKTVIHPEKLPKKGQSLKTTLRVTFDEGVHGCTKILEFTRSLTCKSCEGSGVFSSFSQLNCRDCAGTGLLTAVINTTSVTTQCPTCSPGSDHKEKCSSCNGIGCVHTKKTCTVEVPAGVMSGTTKVFVGQGDEGLNGGESGDFIVCFEVEEHKFFKRDGDNSFCVLEVSFPQAILGSKVEVMTIYGKAIQLDIQPGVQHGQLIKVKGEGFMNETKGKGDFFIQLAIQIPNFTSLQKEEKELVEKLANFSNFKFISIQK